MAKVTKKVVKKRRERKNIEKGAAHIRSTFNNTIITITDVNGNTVATATISPSAKTAVLDLTSVSNPATAVIEFTSATECTYDNISLK